MKKTSKFTFILFLIGTILLSACGQATDPTAEPSFPTTIPVLIPLVGSQAATSTAEPSTPVATLSATTTLLATTLTMQIPSTVPVPLPAAGAIAPGTYFLPHMGKSDFQRIIFTLPAGWATKNGLVYKHLGQSGEVAFSAWIPDQVYADPCHWQGSALSPLDLANHSHDTTRGLILAPEDGGLANQALRGPHPRTLTQVILGSELALRINLSVPAELDISTCDQGQFRSWTDSSAIGGANSYNAPGQLDAVYEVDLDRQALVIDASHMPASSEADLAELDAILGSMYIDRGGPLGSMYIDRGGPLETPSSSYLWKEPDIAAVLQGTLLDPGAYTYDNVDGQGFNVGFTVPSGWTWNGRYLSKGGFDQPDRADIFFLSGPVQIYADPCHWGEPQSKSYRVTGFSDINVLVDQPMRSATTPIRRNASAVHLANRWPGMVVELATLDDFNLAACYGGQYRGWGPEINFRSHVDPGQRDYVWALDTEPPGPGGLIIDAASFPGTPADVRSEIEAILGSIFICHCG